MREIPPFGGGSERGAFPPRGKITLLGGGPGGVHFLRGGNSLFWEVSKMSWKITKWALHILWAGLLLGEDHPLERAVCLMQVEKFIVLAPCGHSAALLLYAHNLKTIRGYDDV